MHLHSRKVSATTSHSSASVYPVGDLPMLSSACQVAPAACLRSQLRRVLCGLSGRKAAVSRTGHRQFSVKNDHRQDTTLQVEARQQGGREERGGFYHRRIHPHGRIIGRPGRRLLQSSEPLATDSLGKPLEVIVLRDVAEEPQTLGPTLLKVNSAILDEEGDHVVSSTNGNREAWTGVDLPAQQDEVNASIDSLRPQSAAVGEAELESLKQQLLQSYNMRQLVRYFLQSLRVAAAPVETAPAGLDESRGIRITPWRPGSTPLEQRIGWVSFKRGEQGKTKAEVVEQILRVSWQLITDKERQHLGELEMYLKKWQILLLFDIKRKEQLMADAVIDSSLLSSTLR